MATIGVQAMMLKDEVAENGLFETMRRVTDIGFRAVEVSQIPLTPETVDGLVRAREELGLDVAALSAGLGDAAAGGNDSLRADFDKVVADCAATGADMVRIGMLPLEGLRDRETLARFAAETDEIALRLREHGIRLYYHNHELEFARFDGDLILDVFAELAPNVGLELDVHWIHRGGGDPAGTISRYAGRVAMVHLKDYRIARVPASVLDSDDPDAFQAFRDDVVQFAEVGEGNLDFTGIIEASLSAGAEYLLVEQDRLYGRTVFECLESSHDNLVALGYADLF